MNFASPSNDRADEYEYKRHNVSYLHKVSRGYEGSIFSSVHFKLAKAKSRKNLVENFRILKHSEACFGLKEEKNVSFSNQTG